MKGFMDDMNDYDTLLRAAFQILMMAHLAAPCSASEEQVLDAIAAVKRAQLELSQGKEDNER